MIKQSLFFVTILRDNRPVGMWLSGLPASCLAGQQARKLAESKAPAPAQARRAPPSLPHGARERRGRAPLTGSCLRPGRCLPKEPVSARPGAGSMVARTDGRGGFPPAVPHKRTADANARLVRRSLAAELVLAKLVSCWSSRNEPRLVLNVESSSCSATYRFVASVRAALTIAPGQ